MGVFILFIFIIYAAAAFVDLTVFGSYVDCPLVNHVLFSFIHIHPVHLIINCSIFYFYWVSFLKRTRLILTIPILVLTTIAASYISASATPTVGLSACVMSITGLLSSVLAKGRMLKTVVLVLLSGCATYFLAPAINTPIHLWSYFLALACGLLVRRWIYE